MFACFVQLQKNRPAVHSFELWLKIYSPLAYNLLQSKCDNQALNQLIQWLQRVVHPASVN